MIKSAFPVSPGSRRNSARSARLALGLLACLAVAQPITAVAHETGSEHAAHAKEHRAHGKAAASPIVVTHVYTATPRPGVPNLAVYIDHLQNNGREADQLLSASTDIARRTELHEMKLDGDMMRMRQLSSIDIPAGATVDMSKGSASGYHVMVLGVTRPLKAGDQFPMTLQFRQAGTQEVQVQVQEVVKAGGAHQHHDHEGHKGHAHGG